jgi:hypothetical protein
MSAVITLNLALTCVTISYFRHPFSACAK